MHVPAEQCRDDVLDDRRSQRKQGERDDEIDRERGRARDEPGIAPLQADVPLGLDMRGMRSHGGHGTDALRAHEKGRTGGNCCRIPSQEAVHQDDRLAT